MHRFIACAIVLGLAQTPSFAQVTLTANTTSNNGLGPPVGVFFDLTAAGTSLTVTDMTTASNAPAGGAFSFQVYTRSGSGLGGPVGSGPGSSPAGWTLIGTANATQGPVASGISLNIDIPDISVNFGSTVGVALVFSGAGARYFGTGTGAPQQFTDGTLTLTTGDARSVPFTTTGSWFSPRGLTGSLTYSAVPEPSSLLLVAGSLVLVRRWKRRK
jgi:hypothetical protein